MTTYIRKRISVLTGAAAVALLILAAAGAKAMAEEDIEAQKAQIVRDALEKLGRPTDNPALYEAAGHADALTAIDIVRTDSETLVEISTTGEPVYRHFLLEAENKLVIDFYSTVNLRHNETFDAPDSGVVDQVRTSLFQLDPQFVSRVVVDMTRLVEMRVDREDNKVVVHVPDVVAPPSAEQPAAVESAESSIVAELKEALAAQKARVAAGEEQLKLETARRVAAEKDLQAALETKAEELQAAVEAERAELAKAREELEAQVSRRVAAEAELKQKLAAAEAELESLIQQQKETIAGAEARLHEEESKRAETESQFVETRQELEKHRAALAKLETDLESARAERVNVEKTLSDALVAKEAEARAQLDERQQALEQTVAKLEEERAANARLAASLQEELAKKEQEAAQQLAEQKSALELLEAELDSARAQIEAAEEKLAVEESTKVEFEAKLAARESELKAMLEEQERALDNARGKLAVEAEARTAAEDQYKKDLDAARKDAEQQTAVLEQTIADLERQLAEQQTGRTDLERELRGQLAEREKETEATIAALQTKIDQMQQVAAEKAAALAEAERVAAEKEAALAEAERVAAEKEQLAKDMAAEKAAALAEAERAAAEKEQLAKDMAAEKAAALDQVKKELAEARDQLAAREKVAQAKIEELTGQIADQEQKLAELETLAQQPPLPPEPELIPPEEMKVSLTFRDADLSSVLDILARTGNINILAGKEVAGTVTARLNNVPLLEALDAILRDNGYLYVIEDGIYRVVGLDHPQGQGMVTEYIRLSNADATDVQTTLKDLVSPTGNAVANKSANAIVIVDVEENIARLRDIVNRLDASLEGTTFAPGEAGLITRSFTLTMADALDVQETIKGLLSPKGKIASNESANMLIVTDRLERVEEIGKLIEQLDVASPVVDVESGLFKLSYARASEVEKILQGVVTEGIGSVIADPRSNQIIVTDTPSNFALIDALIPELDKRVPQVIVEVMIVDAILNDDAQYGVKWLADAIIKQSRDLKNFTFSTNPSGLADTLPPSLDAGVISFDVLGSDLDLSAIIAAEVQDRDARILANPHILVLNNQSATIEIVQEIPFQEITQTTQGPPVSSTEFKDIGVTLTVRPQITHDESIILDLSPEESSISGYSETGIPIEDSRRAQTTLLMDSGATVYIGGLRSISKSLDVSKVPVLGDIPYMGYLFRGTKTSDHRTELMVFVTVRIIEDHLPGLTQDEQTNYDEINVLPEVPDATRDLLHDMAEPTGVRDPLWRIRRKVELPRTK